MKKAIVGPVLGVIAAIAAVVLLVVFVRMTGDPPPTAENVPDYSKMSPEEVTQAYGKSRASEPEAASKR